jgi:glycosyltransferase involved in cell wall biosynthesis
VLIVHLAASPFFGGPERQMLGLANALRDDCRSIFLSFPENGKCEALLEQIWRNGFEGVRLEHNYPRIVLAVRELRDHLKRLKPDAICCHGYKADLLGLIAGKLTGVAVVSVSHGWTAATTKVRFNEWLDRLSLGFMDQIVAVSDAQAKRIRKTSTAADRITVIRNGVNAARFARPANDARNPLQCFFQCPRRSIVVAIGRLSPEKGFSDLIECAAIVDRELPDTGFVIIGTGELHGELSEQIATLRLKTKVILAGFRPDIEALLPHASILAISSYTEGLPTVALEAFAARVPIIATRVGGIPEVVQDGVNGYLTVAGDSRDMANRICQMLVDERLRSQMGTRGRSLIERQFTFESQRLPYLNLFRQLQSHRPSSSSNDAPRVDVPLKTA